MVDYDFIQSIITPTGEIEFAPIFNSNDVTVSFDSVQKLKLVSIKYLRDDKRNVRVWQYQDDLEVRRIRGCDLRDHVNTFLKKPSETGYSTLELRFDDGCNKLYVRYPNQVDDLWIYFKKGYDSDIKEDKRRNFLSVLRFPVILPPFRKRTLIHTQSEANKKKQLTTTTSLCLQTELTSYFSCW